VTATAPRLAADVRALYPFEGRLLRLGCGHRLHYVDEGAGAPLLLLHGNPTWSFHYRELVLGLRDRYRCIAPDHIGCGLSDKPLDWSYHVAAHADNVAELIERLDLRRLTLVTHDWGGPIGYLAALRFPDRIARLVTFNTALSLLPLPRALTLLRGPLLGPVVIRGLNGLVRAGLIASAANGRPLERRARAGYLAPYDSWDHRLAILQFVREIPLEPDHPNRSLLDRVEAALPGFADRPHLVIWGARDPVFHREYLEAWRRRFPDAEVHVLERAGHWVVEEEAARVLALLREFLMRTDPA
jgi:pimeloyl-ACP methyl ester carboxylesterase